MENNTKTKKFYPNIEYNRKKRNKYFVMFAVLVFMLLLMSGWFIAQKFYLGLIADAFIIIFIVLTPRTLKENPVKRKVVLEIDDQNIMLMDKKIAQSDIVAVKVIVYLGSIGNMVENREFLERCAADKPPMEMLGSIEFVVEKDGKKTSEVVIIENVVEALLYFVAQGKVSYRLGYSLGKEYRVSTYNLREFISEKKAEQTEHLSSKGKVKQII